MHYYELHKNNTIIVTHVESTHCDMNKLLFSDKLEYVGELFCEVRSMLLVDRK